jgi:predicted NAD/FAD-dependent oxidoreductase
VVGGGIAGVACARRLVERRIDVVLLDRGRALGGRMATRTLRGSGLPYDGRRVDVGAAYVTADDRRFAHVVDDWVARGLARPWTDTVEVRDPGDDRRHVPGPMRYAAPGGLRSLVEDLAADLPLVVGSHEVADVIRTTDGRVRVDDDVVDAVVLALPAPQALDLLAPDDPVLPVLERQEWDPVLTLVAAYEERAWPVFDAMFVNDSVVVSFVADDGRRRGDDAPVLVAHAAPMFAARHLDDPASAAPALVDALTETVGADVAPAFTDVRRWSLARVREPVGEPFWWDGAVGVCGDAWGDTSRIQTAWLSGTALADRIARDRQR